MKKAFTLAEVLITLGIIGVIAAITIPTLLTNINGVQYRNHFKKSLETLNQAIRLNIANYDYDFSSINSQCVGNGTNDNPAKVQSLCAIFNGSISGITLKNYRNLRLPDGTEYYKFLYNHTTPDSILKDRGIYLYYFQMKDGALFAIHAPWADNNKTSTACSLKGRSLEDALKDKRFETYCTGWIDVNGVSLPNKETRCTDGLSHSKDIDTQCVVKNDATHLGDVFPILIYDGTVAPGSAAARYIINNTK